MSTSTNPDQHDASYVTPDQSPDQHSMWDDYPSSDASLADDDDLLTSTTGPLTLALLTPGPLTLADLMDTPPAAPSSEDVTYVIDRIPSPISPSSRSRANSLQGGDLDSDLETGDASTDVAIDLSRVFYDEYDEDAVLEDADADAFADLSASERDAWLDHHNMRQYALEHGMEQARWLVSNSDSDSDAAEYDAYVTEEEYAQRDDGVYDSDDERDEGIYGDHDAYMQQQGQNKENIPVVSSSESDHIDLTYRKSLGHFGLTGCAPIGLFSIAVSQYACTLHISHRRVWRINEYIYKSIIALSPNNVPCYTEYAEILETRHNDYVNAEKYYTKAVEENEDVISMFNMADMFRELYNKRGDVAYLSKAIASYLRASRSGDVIAKEIVCAMLYDTAEVPDKDVANAYLSDFAEEFVEILDHVPQWPKGVTYEPFREALDLTNMHTNVIREPYLEFAAKTSVLDVYDRLCKRVEEMKMEDVACIAPLQACINKMVSTNIHLIPYMNKVKLFTRLVKKIDQEECGVCYDTKLNIDMQCGHMICTDCYKRVHLTQCPFCRYVFT